MAMRVHDRFADRSEVQMQMGNAAERIAARGLDLATFLTGNRAAIQILAGPATGMEYEVDQPRVTIGRGPGVDLAFDDPDMSRAHACVELGPDGYMLRDLSSGAGTILNDAPVQATLLKDGDSFRVGSHVFGFAVEPRGRDLLPYDVFPDELEPAL
jgi:pSer/pThr/pTyr-binding forkhead associated (FHA) protein